MDAFNRRFFLGSTALAAACWNVQGAFAEELVRTPSQTEGPFYPNKLPRDTDNDLILINDSITPAVGTITHLSGKIVDKKGSPIRGAAIEIWQCDSSGAYLHTESDNSEKRDKHFQGFGRFTSGSTGEYYFRTIKPVSYPGRTPHIHVKVLKNGRELLTTQCYIKGHKQNERDGVLNNIRDRAMRESVQVDFVPVKGSRIGELMAEFVIVLGKTPEDQD